MTVKGKGSVVGFYAAMRVAPGNAMHGFVLQSKQPPGPRTASLDPSTEPWDNLPDPPEGVEYEPARADAYDLTVSTMGPVNPTEANLNSGARPQRPAFNKFTRSAQPLDTRIKCVASPRSYTVI